MSEALSQKSPTSGGRTEQRLFVLEVPIDVDQKLARFGDLVQGRRLRTQFHKIARGVDNRFTTR
ncbi:hypothetical protein G6K97_26830 [Agrobacterium rhizogenes]|uniref:hypothetical protein n=1 Tax=Rhizobium rhizogenes TaxID=359 RepID=UPI001574C902|nr:hypothetical protein [Rhizobium rhizogenes]NTH80785.1 hypothetical protein [Rhizobium rhizogenes]NTH86762.1 hypothetical protein [Rhizobium rhizogenes]